MFEHMRMYDDDRRKRCCMCFIWQYRERAGAFNCGWMIFFSSFTLIRVIFKFMMTKIMAVEETNFQLTNVIIISSALSERDNRERNARIHTDTQLWKMKLWKRWIIELQEQKKKNDIWNELLEKFLQIILIKDHLATRPVLMSLPRMAHSSSQLSFHLISTLFYVWHQTNINILSVPNARYIEILFMDFFFHISITATINRWTRKIMKYELLYSI